MQLVYIIDIFEDNYKTVRYRFETDSVHVMKSRPHVAKKYKENFNLYNLTHSYQKTMEIFTRNNNTENARKPYQFVTNS